MIFSIVRNPFFLGNLLLSFFGRGGGGGEVPKDQQDSVCKSSYYLSFGIARNILLHLVHIVFEYMRLQSPKVD